MSFLRAFSRFALRTACVIAVPAFVSAQDRTPRADSVARRDSIAKLQAVTVTATPAERGQPATTTHIDVAAIRQTPARSPYELLRQAAGVEVHEQGQGPGFASDASLRGFSSDHSTDLATWVDGVPLNEPVNGHAEGYNDLSVLFPGGVQDIDVLHGPTSALFGNFALAGAEENRQAAEGMRADAAYQFLIGHAVGGVSIRTLPPSEVRIILLEVPLCHRIPRRHGTQGMFRRVLSTWRGVWPRFVAEVGRLEVMMVSVTA